jgi:hypothetical protein
MDGLSLNRPSIGRSSSTRKKKLGSSRLSFGPGEIISGDAAEALEDDAVFTPKKITLGRRVAESNLSRASSYRDDDDERPSYSKDYLAELKSSTPSAPKVQEYATPQVEEEQELDASELDGAMIVDTEDIVTHIPTEAEIREKKERRARMAHEQDFISLDDASPYSNQISLLPQRKKTDTRLVREDEDIAEGFDEFVSDGRVALGRKAERAEKRKQKKEMADLISAAEGNDDEESDDSEAERRAAYEAAQTRAGMDGLHKHDDTEAQNTAAQNPTKIAPLPVLSECLTRLQNTLSSMELDLARRKKKLEDSKREKTEIGVRETEVQELLKQTGARYAALKADASGAAGAATTVGSASEAKSLLESNGVSPMVVDRGLESFGNTPNVRPPLEDDD